MRSGVSALLGFNKASSENQRMEDRARYCLDDIDPRISTNLTI